MSSRPYRITASQEAARIDIEGVDQGLGDFNEQYGGLDAVRPLYLMAHDEAGQLAGGIIARTWGECCEVQMLWVEETRRGEGLGRTLMTRAEDAARERGCTLLYLDTFTFQAPELYRGLGYDEDLVIRGFPGGVAKHHFSKRLVDAE
ncbi:MAG: GNAT family N-acetyltransferase [Planctomycetota bacterium]